MRSWLIAVLFGTPIACASDPGTPSAAALDAQIAAAMRATGAKGMAVAVIDSGRVFHFSAQGLRNAAGQPLRTERLRVFRSCPLITPKDPCSSLQMLAIARYGCALRLDRAPSGAPLWHTRKTLSL